MPPLRKTKKNPSSPAAAKGTEEKGPTASRSKLKRRDVGPDPIDEDEASEQEDIEEVPVLKGKKDAKGQSILAGPSEEEDGESSIEEAEATPSPVKEKKKVIGKRLRTKAPALKGRPTHHDDNDEEEEPNENEVPASATKNPSGKKTNAAKKAPAPATSAASAQKGRKRKGTARRGKRTKSEAGGDDSGSEDGGDYEVELIKSIMIHRNGTREYLIQWKGYKKETWEPEENLKGCQEKLSEFADHIGLDLLEEEEED